MWGSPFKCYRLTAKTGTVNSVVEYVSVVKMCSTTKFTVPIFAVLNVLVYNTCRPIFLH